MSAAPHRRGPGFWAAFTGGVALMAWGTGLLIDGTTTTAERLGLALWIVLSDLLVDWLAIPVIATIGWIVARFLPSWARAPSQVGLILSGTVMVLAWLPLQDTAAATGNPTIQPIDYPTTTATTLGVIWLAVASWALRRWHATRA